MECGVGGAFASLSVKFAGEVGSLRIHAYADVEVRTVPA